jgi:DedD protein
MGFLSDVMTDPRPASDDNEAQARHRARRRLIGAGVLLAIGVIGFPLLFETKPRPVPADVPAVQASRERQVAAASPSKVIERPAATAAAAASAVAAASAPSASAERASEVRREIPIPAVAPADATRVAQDKEKEKAERDKAEKARADKERLEKERLEKAKAERERAARDQAKADEARRTKAEEERRARAALDGRSDAKASTATAPEAGRFAVQVGAYASDSSVRDVRNRLERVGLKSYTQVVRSGSGSAAATRVRTGPYASRQDAEKAAEKARSIGLSPSIVPIASAAR